MERDSVVAASIIAALVLGAAGVVLGVKAFRGYSSSILEWEAKGLWVWAIGPLAALLYSLYVADFRASIDEYSSALLEPVAPGEPGFMMVYYILVVTTASVVFAYRAESGYERVMDLIAVGRLARFYSKMLVVLLVTWAPIALSMMLLYTLWSPGYVSSDPLRVLVLIGSEALYLLLVSLLAASLPITVSLVAPYTWISMLSGVMAILILSGGPVSGYLGFDLLSWIVDADPHGGVNWVFLSRLLPVLGPAYGALSLAYARREF